jgi:hypothetical protein
LSEKNKNEEGLLREEGTDGGREGQSKEREGVKTTTREKREREERREEKRRKEKREIKRPKEENKKESKEQEA